jgi:hypothetical protein
LTFAEDLPATSRGQTITKANHSIIYKGCTMYVQYTFIDFFREFTYMVVFFIGFENQYASKYLCTFWYMLYRETVGSYGLKLIFGVVICIKETVSRNIDFYSTEQLCQSALCVQQFTLITCIFGLARLKRQQIFLFHFCENTYEFA